MASLVLQIIWLLWLFGAGAEAQTNSTELAQLYWNVLASYEAFPPLDTSEVWKSGTTEPIQAVLTYAIVSIDVISPGTSEFTVTSRKLMYWNTEACNQTEAHEYACQNPIGPIHFLTPLRSEGDPQVKYEVHKEQVHQSEFEALGLPELTPSMDLIEDQVTYKQTFDVRTYPFEYHNLEVSLTSLYSSNIVNVSLPPFNQGVLNPSVPPGWKLEDVSCGVAAGQEGRAVTEVSEGEIFFPTFTCTIQVSRENTGWWITSFLLFMGLNLIAYVGGLGVASHFVAEARDDKDEARQGLFNGMRLNGVFSIGLLLTYVFQVEIAPYGRPVEFWPRTAASTAIYVVGLAGILMFSFVDLMSALLFKRILVADGFCGKITKTYDLQNVPKEGEVPEEDFPLLNRKEENAEEKVPKGETPAQDTQEGRGDVNMPSLARVKTDESNPEPDRSPTITSSEETTADGGATETNAKEAPVPPAEKSLIELENAEEGSPIVSEEKNEPAPSSRRKNTKNYSVLSIQEAVMINRLVRLEFFVATFLIVGIAVAGAIILSMASRDFQDAIA